MKNRLGRIGAAVALASCVFAAVASAQEVAVKPAPLSPEIYQLRRQFLNGPINALAYHTMDSVFATTPVAAPKQAWALARAEKPLDFSYEFKGKTYPAETVLERTYGSALLILKDDKIVYERYRNFTGPSTRFIAMSMSKSINSILLGVALRDGAIKSIDQKITDYIPELKGTAYDGVTIRQALDMKTGVDRNDGDQLKWDTPPGRMREQILVQNARAAVDEASLVKRKEQPGKVFDYTTLNATVLGWVIERATKQPFAQYTQDKLWTPLGAEYDAFWMTDGFGPTPRPLAGLGFNATLRDYGRVGLMMMHNGMANGQQVIPAAWALESTEPKKRPPTAAGSDLGYEHEWWLDLKSPAFSAIGLAGQYIFVDRTHKTVVVKLSFTPLDKREAMDETVAFLRAAAAWTPK
jgi:CubicO group peptidase (beta-lactamase class C family)